MGIFDLVLIAIAVVALIIGLVKGGAGFFFGFLGTLIIAVAVAIGAIFIVPQVAYKDSEIGFTAVEEDNYGCSDMFYALYQPISSLFESEEDNELLNAKYTADAGMIYGPFGEEGEYVEIELQEVMLTALPIEGISDSLGGLSSFVSGIISSGANEGITVGQAISNCVTRLAFGVIVWFIAFLVLFIIKRIIRKALFKALDAHPIASKIDRLIGAIIIVAVVIVIAWVGVSYLETNKESFGLSDDLEEIASSNFTYRFFASNNLFGTTADPLVDIPIETE